MCARAHHLYAHLDRLLGAVLAAPACHLTACAAAHPTSSLSRACSAHLRFLLPASASQDVAAGGEQHAAGAHSLDDAFNHDDTQQQQGSDEMQSFGDDDDDGSHAGSQQPAPRLLVEGVAGADASTQQHDAALQQGLDLSLMGERQEEQAESADSDDGFLEEFPDAAMHEQAGDGSGDSGDEFADGGLAQVAASAGEQDSDMSAQFELSADGGEQGGDAESDEFFDSSDADEGTLTTAADHGATEENDRVGWRLLEIRCVAGGSH